MKVLVDTSVWSLALCRKHVSSDSPVVAELAELVREGRATILGAIRQELLSGVRTSAQFETLRERLAAFPDYLVTTDSYERAATFFNQCRSRGVAGSSTDFLICAVGASGRLPIFTMDQDFERFARILPIEIHRVQTALLQ
ncbi:MAG: PIN domain-containing protein [Polyangiaceae bacterium]|nr:PIN domain-containing protein [Polyangiaceae bacterium]